MTSVSYRTACHIPLLSNNCHLQLEYLALVRRAGDTSVLEDTYDDVMLSTSGGHSKN
jgi:hypothetical protein